MRDELVFWERIEQHRSVLSRYISAVVTDTGLSEEIIQDVYLIAWLKYDSFIFSPNPWWLVNEYRQIYYFKCFAQKRSRTS